MIRHHLELRDASVLATRHLLLTRQAIADLVDAEAMGAIVGSAGLGKTFAIGHTLQERHEPVISLTFEARPTMRLVADRLMHGSPGSRQTAHRTRRRSARTCRRRQIGDDQILNCQVPDAARPILRALDRGFGPVF